MNISNTQLLQSIKEIILESRMRVYRMANIALLQTYWQIGKLIIEPKQAGNAKAAYGNATLKNLGTRLTLEFGRGFDYTNLTNMRKFYLVFPILDALRQELSWTHYLLLCRLNTEAKRNYYLQESIINNWNRDRLDFELDDNETEMDNE